ncbi:MAG: DNA cytosine methyltransferase [Pseudomonadota bacterium]
MPDLVIDNFAGGGGASLGIEQAIGRPIDIAINHDAAAIAMHMANHPDTKHFVSDVWEVNPLDATNGKSVELAWFSPDCKHFSKAKGGKPVSKRIRGLAWVVIKWAKAVRPRIIMLENVEEFQTWGPVLDSGQPCPERRGHTFRRWVNQLTSLGYDVEWKELRACDYGAPTIRKRLFLIARLDGQPIVWPDATHGPGLSPYSTAAECMDFTLECPSIFARKRPLAEATMRRIARGIDRYVLNNSQPFIVGVGGRMAQTKERGLDQPFQTLTSKADAAFVSPYLIPRHGERPGQEPRTRPVQLPLPTITPTQNGAQLVAAFLAQHNTGMTGHNIEKPLSTITGRGTQQQLVTSHLVKLRNNQHSQSIADPMPTITAGGGHVGEVRAFLTKYYGKSIGQDLIEPLHTVTTKDTVGLVTIHGLPYEIVDIGMRMLSPKELFAAQGFPADYITSPHFNGKTLTKTAQVRMCGNSVSPPVARALVEANITNQAEVAA